MKIFSLNYDNNTNEIKRKKYSIKFKVEKIIGGIIIRGKIRGRAKRIEIIKDSFSGIIFANNWQSWGDSRPITTKEFEKKRKIPKNKYMYHIMPNTYFNNLVSDYFVASENKLIGFLSSKIAHGFFKIDQNTVRGYLDFFNKTFNEYTDLEPLIIIEGKNVEEVLEKYADHVKFENKVRVKHKPQFGWSSWYQYYDKLTWKDVEKNLKLAKKYEYQVFQIDDSWQRDIGDWKSNDSFPSPKTIADRLSKYGFEPGIWLAPFNVAESSNTFKKHKKWLIKDSKERPKIAYYNWNKKIYSLDLTNPEVKDHIFNLFARLKKAGFNYFKIDFLFSGALPGIRYDNTATPIEAYRIGMNIIREAAGNSFILGCGAPLLPSLGFVDGMRISEDTAPIYVINPEIRINAYGALKTSINRYFMNERWWINDPDCLILRKEKSELDEKVRKIYSYVSGILNYSIFQSDDLSLSIDKNALFEALKLRGGKVKVRGLLKNEYRITSIHPVLGKIELKTSLENKSYSIKIENKENNLIKKSVLKEDGRLFHFYNKEGI